MTVSDAWLIHCSESLKIAVSDREMIELVHEQSCYPVPGSPDYCSSVVTWQGRLVPIMDLTSLHTGVHQQYAETYLCLLNYQDAPGVPLQQIALRVTQAPEHILVDDSQVCEWPAMLASSRLKPVTLSCFSHADIPVLILDITKLCSAEFRELAAA